MIGLVVVWDIEWGSKEDFLYDVWSKTGEEPEALASKPVPHGYLMEYLRAFRLLHTRRSPSPFGGVNPISLMEMQAYLEIFGCWDIEEFVDVMVVADSAIMSYMAEKAQAAEEAKSGRTGKNAKS